MDYCAPWFIGTTANQRGVWCVFCAPLMCIKSVLFDVMQFRVCSETSVAAEFLDSGNLHNARSIQEIALAVLTYNIRQDFFHGAIQGGCSHFKDLLRINAPLRDAEINEKWDTDSSKHSKT